MNYKIEKVYYKTTKDGKNKLNYFYCVLEEVNFLGLFKYWRKTKVQTAGMDCTMVTCDRTFSTKQEAEDFILNS